MKKIFVLSLFSMFFLGITGCVSAPPQPASVIINTQNSANTYPQNATSNNLMISPDSPTVTYGQVALLGFNLNNSGNKITVKPGEIIPATAMYLYYCPTCQLSSINQIIIGLAGEGAQACLYNGSTQDQGIAHFTLKAPQKPGVYQVRFRYAQAYSCQEAVRYWWKVDHAPAAQATVGIITVQ